MTMPEPIYPNFDKEVPAPIQPTQLIPQEIYLLERYSSKEYFLLARDGWEAMVKHVEACLALFMRQLPLDYRSRELPYQPDIVWGERVLPNFRNTLDSLISAYIRLTHGDLQMLGAACEIGSDLRGSMEFWSGWMDEPSVSGTIPNAEQTYERLMQIAAGYAGNIRATIRTHWDCTNLRQAYNAPARGPLAPPQRWPRYRLNQQVRAKTGEPVPQTGIYLPDIENSCAALLIKGDEDASATVLTHTIESYDRESGRKEDETPISELRATTWTLVERVPGEFVDDPLADLLQTDSASDRIGRVPAGQSCPRTGWWHTPAKLDSRRRFVEGEMFPVVEGSDYGATFWLWSQE